jgi:hypothetical protein
MFQTPRRYAAITQLNATQHTYTLTNGPGYGERVGYKLGDDVSELGARWARAGQGRVQPQQADYDVDLLRRHTFVVSSSRWQRKIGRSVRVEVEVAPHKIEQKQSFSRRKSHARREARLH